MKKIDKILRSMTKEEKASITVGFSRKGKEIYPKGAAGITFPVPRLGVPSVVMADGPAGVRIDTEGGTKFGISYPCESNLACTFNTELVKDIGRCIGKDARNYGIDIILAPALNIQRDPLGGRNFEYFSEDPCLIAKMGTAYVKGVQSSGTGACIKHLACNNRETDRGKYSAEIDERTLREVYLSAFREVVFESSPYCIMTAYNKINGIYTSVDASLTKEIVFGEWAYDGMIMSDWGADGDNIERVRAQNDLYMEGNAEKCEEVISAVECGTLSEEEIEICSRHILGTVMRTHSAKGAKPSGKLDITHLDISEKAAVESIVLLENKDMLPLDCEKISLFGNAQRHPVIGGLGAGDVNTCPYSSFRDALKSRFSLGKTADEIYKNCPRKPIGFDEDENPENDVWEVNLSEDAAAKAAEESDASIVFISRLTREGKDHTPRKGDYRLNERERNMLITVSNAFHMRGKKVCVVLDVGNPIEVESWKQYADALVFLGYAGQRSAEALASILRGEKTPSARLAFSIPVACEDSPAHESFLTDNLQIPYNEGIFVGYRYYEKMNKRCSYSFGYGLSYTQFRCGDLKIVERTDGQLVMSQTVKNVGMRGGKHAALLYVSKPDCGDLAQAKRQLIAFSKTSLLFPGEEETVFFHITKEALYTWKKDKGFVLLKGKYIFEGEEQKFIHINF